MRLIDGEGLLNLMLRHRFGVREEAGRLVCDTAFFDGLDRRSAALGGQKTRQEDIPVSKGGVLKSVLAGRPKLARWTLCIRLTPPPSGTGGKETGHGRGE